MCSACGEFCGELYLEDHKGPRMMKILNTEISRLDEDTLRTAFDLIKDRLIQIELKRERTAAFIKKMESIKGNYIIDEVFFCKVDGQDGMRLGDVGKILISCVGLGEASLVPRMSDAGEPYIEVVWGEQDKE
jgi:hypothetical protein